MGFKETVSTNIEVYFRLYKIRSVLSVSLLIVLQILNFVVSGIFTYIFVLIMLLLKSLLIIIVLPKSAILKFSSSTAIGVNGRMGF
jgi:hypothetical protein